MLVSMSLWSLLELRKLVNELFKFLILSWHKFSLLSLGLSGSIKSSVNDSLHVGQVLLQLLEVF